jgi:hypothetical protein
MFSNNLLVGRNRAIDREQLYGIRPPVRVKILAFYLLFFLYSIIDVIKKNNVQEKKKKNLTN